MDEQALPEHIHQIVNHEAQVLIRAHDLFQIGSHIELVILEAIANALANTSPRKNGTRPTIKSSTMSSNHHWIIRLLSSILLDTIHLPQIRLTCLFIKLEKHKGIKLPLGLLR